VSRAAQRLQRVASHRPAVRRRRFKHDRLTAVDLFSGFGGLTEGIRRAGFDTIMAANHNAYKVEVHEANHPYAEHWIADLINKESSDYHDVRDLPAADLLVAGVTCTNHSQANTIKAYEQGLTLFELEDPDFEERITRSERDRATANCFPAGTVVVARRGMVPIEELVIGDEVLTHKNRWRQVSGTMSRRANIFTVKGRGHTDLEVTENHQFLTRQATKTSRGWTFSEDERWTKAADLVGHAWQSPVEFPDIEVPPAPVGWEYGHHFWWTVGRWLGDGWIRHCTPSGEMVAVCCGHAERAELDGRWPSARTTETPSTVNYEMRGSGPFARWLMAYFGERAPGKTIPAWALSMDVEYRKALVEGYLSADGATGLDGRRGTCATVSRRLAIGMKLLLQSLGYRPTLRCRKPEQWQIEGRTGTTRPMWILQWMAEQRRASTLATIGGRCVGVVREVLDEGRETEVFDIEVEEDHSFIADGILVHNCVLHYAAKHRPRMILVECTTEITSWGVAVPGRKKVGDGSTYRWWLKQFDLLGYNHKVMYLNTQFFGVSQSRDRWFCGMWLKELPAPDLEHRPHSWCDRCHTVVEAVWTWKTGIPPTGSVRYGKQYNYTCPSCRREVIPPMAPSINALDLTDLGARIGDKPLKRFVDKDTGEVSMLPMAPATMARAERCRQRFPEFPAVLMPAKAVHGTEKHPWQPMATQTSQQETSLLSTGAVMAAAGNTFERPGSDCRSRDLSEPLWSQTATNTTGLVTPPVAVTGMVTVGHRHNGDGQHISRPMDTVTSTHEKAVFLAVNNYQGAPRGVHESLPTQPGSETLSLLSTGVVPFRKHTIPTTHGEPMPAVTSEQIPGLLTAAGTIKNNGSIDEAQYRAHPVSDPLGTVVGSGTHQSLLTAGWFKQNGTSADATAPHPVVDPFGTLTSRDTTGVLMAEWRDMLSRISLEDCYFRMLGAHEIGRGCGFDVSFPGYGYEGSFVVWGSARDQTDGFGNAVTPAVGEWIGHRLREALHRSEAVA
jgi:DNA (cytosine-5)-methyltransferase 1